MTSLYKKKFEPNLNFEKVFSSIKAEDSSLEKLHITSTCFPSPQDYNLSRNQISKKTNRGRKEKISLPKYMIKCEICLQYKDISKEEIIFCCVCKCLFHKSCNPQYEVLPSISDKIQLYRCIRCSQAIKSNKPITDYKCFICDHSNYCLNYNTQNRLFYHQICLFFINELHNLKKEEMIREMIRKWRYKNSCKYCGEKLSKSVAVIKCSKPQCKEYYHTLCAIDKGMIFDLTFMKKYYNKSNFTQIPFFCVNHNKKISHEYKTDLMNKLNEKEKEKEDKKTFQNVSDFEEEKENEKNEMECNEEDGLCKDMASMSIFDSEDEKENENKAEEDLIEQNSGTNDSMNMDVEDSGSNDANNIFNLDFKKIIENVENDKKNFNYYEQLNLRNNNYKNGFNVDDFCSNKNRDLIMIREDSNNYLKYNL